MGKIFVTGDIHGTNDIFKLSLDTWSEQQNLTKNDYLIICGDFGFIWQYSPDEYENKWLDYLQSKPFSVLFVDGNHENHARLQHMPTEEWKGGLVHKLRKNVMHLCRGSVFKINGYKILAMGGASSIDKWDRIEDVSWWKEELPSIEDYATCIENLEKVNWKVDYVVSHCCSSQTQRKIDKYYSFDELTEFFDTLESQLTFKSWYFGHYHRDYPLDVKHYICYNMIRDLSDGKLVASDAPYDIGSSVNFIREGKKYEGGIITSRYRFEDTVIYDIYTAEGTIVKGVTHGDIKELIAY